MSYASYMSYVLIYLFDGSRYSLVAAMLRYALCASAV